MDKRKQRRLENAGWRLGTAVDFLELTDAEAALVELKVRLSEALRARRLAQGISQAVLAKQLRSSQSRVAKMEAADPTVSLDLLLRGLLVMGAKSSDVAKALHGPKKAAA